MDKRLRDLENRLTRLKRELAQAKTDRSWLQQIWSFIANRRPAAEPTTVNSPCCNDPIKTTLVLIGPGRFNTVNINLVYNFSQEKWIGSNSSYRWEFHCDGDTQPNFELRIFNSANTLLELQSEPADCGPPFLWTDRDSIRD